MTNPTYPELLQALRDSAVFLICLTKHYGVDIDTSSAGGTRKDEESGVTEPYTLNLAEVMRRNERILGETLVVLL